MSDIFAIHPGEILLTKFMQPLGPTACRLAKELSGSAPRVNDTVVGKRATTADSALRPGLYFNLPPQSWLNLQNGYHLRHADLRHARAYADLHIKPHKAA